MSVQVEYHKNDCRLVVTVTCKDISSNDGINGVFDELDIAVRNIQKHIGEDGHWYFLINIVAEGVPPALGEFGPYEPGTYIDLPNPWEVFCPSFWTKASKNPQSRRRIAEWIGRLEETLKLAEARSLATASLWEHDETQFGEPLVTHLALIDVQFVPFFTRLLRLWDMGHEVHTGGAVIETVKRHGLTPETEELILCYTETTGSDELGLLDLLKRRKRR